MRKPLFGISLVALALAASLALACGNGDADADPTPVTTFPITPADGRTVEPEETPTAEATEPAETPGAETPAAETPTNGEATTLELVAVNILFDQTELTAPAGTVIIELDNQDGGIPHNVHVFEGTDATGESVGMTPIKPGPAQDTLTLELEPGTYFYQCDVHPTTMTGTLTVT